MQELKIGGIYRHYKGNLYKVLMTARHSETEEELVIYEALYEQGGTWARPKAMFLEQVTVNSKLLDRFSLVEQF